jgi:hypothetical protein
MNNETKEYYDTLPVVACKYCKSLHIKTDDNENDICMSCGSINQIDIYDNIEQYNEKCKTS